MIRAKRSLSTLTRWLHTLLLAVAISAAAPVQAERIKDIAGVGGVRTNQLVGYGLVVGLDGTGDQTTQVPFTVQSLKNMLDKLGVSLPPGVVLNNVQPKNVAAVTVHADLPPFAKSGQTIDVTVSSIGNAKSLRGGTLLMTPMKGADGRVYAVAQGSLVVSGFGAEGSDGSRVAVNVQSVGRVPNGATVERSANTPLGDEFALMLNIHSPDFTTANRVAEAVNTAFGPGIAEPVDAGSIRVNAPRDRGQRVSFLAMLENLEVESAQAPARVVVNSRTGTVVIGQHVKVMPAAVSHGSLVVTITERPIVSQPAPFARGETAVVPQSDVTVEEQGDRMFLFQPGVSLDEIVRAVNEVGAAPGDLVAILEALRSAGALRAELIVI